MNIIKNLPTPIAGLALGSVALGNLLQPYSLSLQLLFNTLSLIIIVLLTIKFVLEFDKLKKELANPVIATVLATYPMSIMLLSSFSKKFIGAYSIPFWIVGILLDLFVVCYAIYNFVLKEKHIKNIYPTWFITFVGPAVVTVTAINYNLETLGLIYFYFSYINYLVLLPFVLYRVYKYKHYNDGDYPTITVFSAPGGLLLASYMIGVTQKSNIILAVLIPLTVLLFIFVSSILFNRTVSILKSTGILFLVSFIFNLLLILGYSGTLDIALVSNIAIFGSIFMNQLSKKNDNLKFLYSGAVSIAYLILVTLVFETSIILYIFAFILGVFLELLLMKRKNLNFLLLFILIFCISGELIQVMGVDTKSIINGYRASRVDSRLVKVYTDEDIFNLEKELTSKNKSVLTYYELGMVKITTSTKQDAKKVFLEGINFDDTFAPIYYNLAVIERQEGNYEKAKEYARRAFALDGSEKNKNLTDELSKF